MRAAPFLLDEIVGHATIPHPAVVDPRPEPGSDERGRWSRPHLREVGAVLSQRP